MNNPEKLATQGTQDEVKQDKTSLAFWFMTVFPYLLTWLFLCLWCLTPLSARFQLYRSGQFYWCRKLEFLEKTTDPSQETEELYHIMAVQCTLRHVRVRTHNISGDTGNTELKNMSFSTITRLKLNINCFGENNRRMFNLFSLPID